MLEYRCWATRKLWAKHANVSCCEPFHHHSGCTSSKHLIYPACVGDPGIWAPSRDTTHKRVRDTHKVRQRREERDETPARVEDGGATHCGMAGTEQHKERLHEWLEVAHCIRVPIGTVETNAAFQKGIVPTPGVLCYRAWKALPKAPFAKRPGCCEVATEPFWNDCSDMESLGHLQCRCLCRWPLCGGGGHTASRNVESGTARRHHSAARVPCVWDASQSSVTND